MNQLLEYRSKLIDHLVSTGEEFRRSCLGIDEPFKATEEDGWNMHQLATHARDVQRMVYGMRIRRTVDEDNPEFQSFDADDWMAEHYEPDEPLASVLDELSASITETVSMLRELPPEAWSRESSHEVYGEGFTLQTWVERGLAHIEEHLQTVQKAA